MGAAADAALENGRVRWIADTIHDIGYHKPAELAQVMGDFLENNSNQITTPQRTG